VCSENSGPDCARKTDWRGKLTDM